jgi:hypothetical protein
VQPFLDAQNMGFGSHALWSSKADFNLELSPGHSLGSEQGRSKVDKAKIFVFKGARAGAAQFYFKSVSLADGRNRSMASPGIKFNERRNGLGHQRRGCWEDLRSLARNR